jgi:hypothetical protein
MSRAAVILRWVSLVATLAGIATLEYLAGNAAGWGQARSIAVPVALDAFVMSALLWDRSRWYDRAFALGLMEATVVLSVVAGTHDQRDSTVLGAALATALVLALWRVDSMFRAAGHHRDELADAVARLTHVIPDGDRRGLAQVVRETVTSHAVGWGTVKAAIEAGGWSVGNTGRVKTAIAQRKADLPDEPRRGLSAVGG